MERKGGGVLKLFIYRIKDIIGCDEPLGRSTLHSAKELDFWADDKEDLNHFAFDFCEKIDDGFIRTPCLASGTKKQIIDRLKHDWNIIEKMRELEICDT